MNSHALPTVPVYKKNGIASLLCIFETIKHVSVLLSNCKQSIVSLSLLVGTTVVTFVFPIALYNWNLNFSRMNASLECMIFFIRISRNYVVSIYSVPLSGA